MKVTPQEGQTVVTGPIAFFYDSETDGLPQWNDPSNDPRQPHIVEIAAILRNREGSIRKPFHAIVRPDGYVIPEEMTKIHGISQERALAEGRPAAEVYREFMALWEEAAFRVAHSEGFDARMVRIELKRHMTELADRWKAGPARCTAELSTPYCKLPPTEKMIAAGRGHQFKKPKLEEALRILCGEELKDAHSALADVEACSKIYLALWEKTHA